MSKKNLDGKTYYYLLDEVDILHVCSDGKTACGLDASLFSQVEDIDLSKYTVCPICTDTKTKKAYFETKAELVDEPARGTII